MKKKILILVGSYLPGTKSAGVTTSISRMVEELSDKLEFYILTEDRDKGDTKPYQNVELERWVKYGKANVFYSSKYLRSIVFFSNIVKSIDFDMYYINGFYNISDNARFFIMYVLGMIPPKRLIVAPRGIFSLGMFDNKLLLRNIYRSFFSLLGVVKLIDWHVTSDIEKDDVLKRFPECKNKISIIPNLTCLSVASEPSNIVKNSGDIRIMFISRISEKKNIKMSLEIMKKVIGHVVYDLYGMIGTENDKKYWEECKKIISQLPPNIEVKYHGEVTKEVVPSLFKNHHLFLFPTFGENYGHVIAESLASGCPILLSDTTPWNMLEKYGAGFNVSLLDIEGYVNRLQKFIDMDNQEWRCYSSRALAVANDFVDNNRTIRKYIKYFISNESESI